MSIKITDDDFIELATQIKNTLNTHNIATKKHAPLITDIIFNFACFIDDKSNTNFHEFIETKLDKYLFEIMGESPGTLVASVNLVFGKGRKRDFQLTNGHMKHRESIISLLEFTTGIRKLTEIDSKVELSILSERLEKIIETRNGLLAIEFQAAKDFGTNKWSILPLPENQFGKFKYTIDDITDCIYKVIEQWS